MFNRNPKICDAFCVSVTPGDPEKGVDLTLGIESNKGAEFMRNVATIHMEPDQARYMYEALKELFDSEN